MNFVDDISDETALYPKFTGKGDRDRRTIRIACIVLERNDFLIIKCQKYVRDNNNLKGKTLNQINNHKTTDIKLNEAAIRCYFVNETILDVRTSRKTIHEIALCIIGFMLIITWRCVGILNYNVVVLMGCCKNKPINNSFLNYLFLTSTNHQTSPKFPSLSSHFTM
jgi:hypothetical protein